MDNQEDNTATLVWWDVSYVDIYYFISNKTIYDQLFTMYKLTSR